MATGTIPRPKPKVKEETKDCCGYRQSSVTTATSTSSASSEKATLADDSHANVVNDTNGVAATRSTTVTTTASVTVTMTTTTTTTTTTTATTTASAVAATTTTTTTTVNASATACSVHDHPFRGDPDLGKTMAKGSIAIREKSSRNDGRSETPSPSSHRQQRQRQSASRQRSDSGSPLLPSSHGPKPETEDATIDETGGPPEEAKDDASSASSASSSGGIGIGVRCIAGVFAGHGELKSVLGTVVKFATGISPDTGDTVLTLVLALLSGGMTAEEFHSALQEATNYSLKDFVLPHLKQQLPALQRDLSTAARAGNQSCAQFLRSNEAAVLEAVGLVSATEPVEIFGDQTDGGTTTTGNIGGRCSVRYGARSTNSVQHTGNATAGSQHYSNATTTHAPKRRASDTPYYENGAALLDDVPVYGKRLTNPWSHHPPPQRQQSPSTESSAGYCWYRPLRSTSGSIQGHGHRHAHGHGLSPIPTGSLQMSQMNAFASSHHPIQQPSSQQQQQQQQPMNHGQAPPNGSLDDEWKNIHMMLNCILGMVEKTKKALAILQSRGCLGVAPAAAVIGSLQAATGNASSQNGAGTGGGNHPSSTNGSQVESSTGDREGSLKRLSGEIVAQTIRAIEDKVAEVKRKDEEAVKRAVMAEVQRAVRVAVAESRASERLRVHHRPLDVPHSQRSHGVVRQPTYLRVHGGNHGTVDANARTGATAAVPSASIPSTSEDEKEPHPQQTVSGSNCWNCGRPALETCGGCGIARYCGSFCQHRDWEAGGHHASCNNNPPPREQRRSVSRSPPRIPSGALSASPLNEAKLGSAIVAAPVASKSN